MVWAECYFSSIHQNLLPRLDNLPFIVLVNQKSRGVAQTGSALEWGSRGRRFKSFRPDQLNQKMTSQSMLRNREDRSEKLIRLSGLECKTHILQKLNPR